MKRSLNKVSCCFFFGGGGLDILESFETPGRDAWPPAESEIGLGLVCCARCVLCELLKRRACYGRLGVWHFFFFAKICFLNASRPFLNPRIVGNSSSFSFSQKKHTHTF